MVNIVPICDLLKPGDECADADHGDAVGSDDVGDVWPCGVGHTGGVLATGHTRAKIGVSAGSVPMSAEVEERWVWLVAPLPDPDWGSDMRPAARLFETESAARAILDNCPPEFHLWRYLETTTTTRTWGDYELID